MGMLNYEEHIKEHELIALRYPEKAPVLASNGVTAQTNPLTGGIEILANGDELATSSYYDKPIITIGGDHPYLQWYGTNGNDGMLQLYLDNGIKPYCAINWEASASSSGAGGSFRDVVIGGSQTEMMSVAEGLLMQSKGLEFVNHGTRHPNKWDQLNSGIRIDYNGTASPAKVFISGDGKNATEIKLQDADHVGTEITLKLSNYSTLTELQAAIDAADGAKWTCELAAELTGNEDPKWLWPIAAAGRTVTGGTTPYNNRRFCISGGVYALYKGATYQNCTLHVESNGELKIFIDGVRAATSGTPGTQSLSSVLSSLRTAMTSFGVSVIPTATPNAAGDFYIDVMGNGKDSVGTAIRETYMQGDELCAYMTQSHDDCTGRATNITYGLPLTYVIERQVKRLVELSTAAGFSMKNFAQAGSNFPPHLIPHVLDVKEWRLDPSTFGFVNNSPMAMPACMDYQWHPMATALPTTGPQVKAIIDAAIDSGAWAIDILLHSVTTGSFGNYTFPGFTGTPDIPATDLIDTLQYLRQKKSAGLVDVVPPEQFRKLRRMRAKPKNLVFNPFFRNSEAHGGTALLDSSSNGATLPGWQCAFPVARFSAISVDDGALSCTVSPGTASYILRQGLWLEPGKRYDVGFDIDAGLLTAGSVYIGLRPTRMRPDGTLPTSTTPSITGKAVGAKSFSHMRMRVSHDNVKDWTPNRVMSKSGPFNINSATAPRSANINIMGIGNALVNFDDVVSLTAATPAEIATRINAAIAGTAAYANRVELHDIAKVVNGRVILDLPFRNVDPLFSLITVTQVNSGLCAAIFGGAEVYSYGTPFGAFDAGVCQYTLDITLSADAAGTFKIRAPYCREVTSA